MNKHSWRIRLLVWVAVRICRIPFTVNFTPANQEEFYAIGFAATAKAANRMRGDDMLIERLQNAEAAALALKGTRKGRRVMNTAAKKAARKASRK